MLYQTSRPLCTVWSEIQTSMDFKNSIATGFQTVQVSDTCLLRMRLKSKLFVGISDPFCAMLEFPTVLFQFQTPYMSDN